LNSYNNRFMFVNPGLQNHENVPLKNEDYTNFMVYIITDC